MESKKFVKAAISGLLTSAVFTTGCATWFGGSSGSEAKGECHGVNGCKGTGSCGGEGHGCAGKNACKGKGWVPMAEKECKEKGGEFKKKM